MAGGGAMMARWALTLLLGLLAAPASAQLMGQHDPRLQTLVYRLGEPMHLVAFPNTDLTLLFDPGERIERVVVSNRNAVRAGVVGSGDALALTLERDMTAKVAVATNLRQYSFSLEAGEGLAAAHLVRLVSEAPAMPPVSGPRVGTWGYSLSGSRMIRPLKISDDGSKTFIEWGPDQALPAVFGIGPTGSEEVVAGYMRSGLFVIDRVYPRLVFRMDKKKAQATRVKARLSHG